MFYSKNISIISLLLILANSTNAQQALQRGDIHYLDGRGVVGNINTGRIYSPAPHSSYSIPSQPNLPPVRSELLPYAPPYSQNLNQPHNYGGSVYQQPVGNYSSSLPKGVVKLDSLNITLHCSGAIVLKRWVMTAAHCVMDSRSRVKSNVVIYHKSDGGSGKKYVQAHNVFVHPEYNPHPSRAGFNDLALLYVPEGFPSIAGKSKMSFYNDRNQLSQVQLFVSGFVNTSHELTNFPVAPENNSRVAHGGYEVITPGTPGRQLCIGMSGGMLWSQDKSTGVTLHLGVISAIWPKTGCTTPREPEGIIMQNGDHVGWIRGQIDSTEPGARNEWKK